MNADQQHRRLGNVLPTVNLHPKPVVDKQIPHKFVAVHSGLVLAVEIPFAGPFGYPAAETAVLLVPLVPHCRPRLIGMTLHLLANFFGPEIASTHADGVPG